ncbi:MAG: biotin--[Clostridia bacterium]|nr:biotin--[acetyl-CoA-carboxylase] ligase [Clostridia bacterium]
MNTKEKVLSILNNNVGRYVSGQTLAQLIGISRNSVWKAVMALKAQGYDISSHASRGYALINPADIFTEENINSYLSNAIPIHIYENAPSSNNIAKELAQAGAKEGTTVVVLSQSAGKGRMGRSFLSSSTNGLYMSVVLRPKIPVDRCVSITVLGAVAVAEAIEEVALCQCQIKWVNDIYINDKKVSGILTEASINFECAGLEYAVIGIGVNISQPEGGFDSEIKDIATSIFKDNAPPNFKARLCAKILERLFYHYNKIEEREYIEPYRKKSSIIGKSVDVHVGNRIVQGIATDIDEEARLVVKTDSGVEKFNSGEARVRKNESK